MVTHNTHVLNGILYVVMMWTLYDRLRTICSRHFRTRYIVGLDVGLLVLLCLTARLVCGLS